MSQSQRLERPQCPACSMWLDPLKKIVRSEEVYWCAWCAREWLENEDGIWFEDGVKYDAGKWTKDQEE